MTRYFHSLLLASDLSWFVARWPFTRRCSRRVRIWLAESGSLTARLQAAAGAIRVRVLYEGRGWPFESERQCLQWAHGQPVWIREVILYTGECPLLAARTVAPEVTLRGGGAGFAHLGSRPLGALLFNHPGVVRKTAEWVALNRGRWRLHSAAVPRWGRRTLYEVNGKPLLVNEFFLPIVFELEAGKGDE